jgi:hypothetical protein
MRIKAGTTPAPTQREFLRRWWWFDPAHVAKKCEASEAWETARRTREYPRLWRKFRKDTVSLLQHQGKPELAGAMQHMHLFQRLRGALSASLPFAQNRLRNAQDGCEVGTKAIEGLFAVAGAFDASPRAWVRRSRPSDSAVSLRSSNRPDCQY